MKLRNDQNKLWAWIGVSSLVMLCMVASSCVSISDGTWYIREASLPDSWPQLTPVGQVHIKEYPEYRAAVVQDQRLPNSNQKTMFKALFQHIKDREIAMTAPVEMGYVMVDQNESADAEMISMAFLYRQPTQGKVEADGSIVVKDLPGRTHASIGVRGGYTEDRFMANMEKLDSWLKKHDSEWLPSGPPRYLGYNSPFVPPFMRYGEVQLPIKNAQD